jgi:hypothetical protein
VTSSTVKKVILDRFDRPAMAGYVNLPAYLQPDGVELLSKDGSCTVIPYEQIKAVSFVRDLVGHGVFGDRLEFLARPKLPGLWLEFHFRDNETLQGHVANDLLGFEAAGYSFTPPDLTGNAQRVFVPRQALRSVTVLGVVGSRPPRGRPKPQETRQIRLFTEA